MTEFPELTPDEADEFAELSGKRIADGMDKTQADNEALAEILKRRRDKEQSKEPFRFRRIGDIPNIINLRILRPFSGDFDRLNGRKNRLISLSKH